MNKILKYFFSGLIFYIPIFIIWEIFKSISGVVKTFNEDIYGLYAFFISLSIILLTGFLLSKIFKNSIRTKIIKKSKQDGLFSFFYKVVANYKIISEKTKKSFSKPIFYESSDGIEKIGFITNKKFNNLNLEKNNKKIAVYSPNPVNFIGELLFIDEDKIREIPKELKHNTVLTLLSAGIIDKNDLI